MTLLPYCRYHSFDELYEYCYKVAGTVGASSLLLVIHASRGSAGRVCCRLWTILAHLCKTTILTAKHVLDMHASCCDVIACDLWMPRLLHVLCPILEMLVPA